MERDRDAEQGDHQEQTDGHQERRDGGVAWQDGNKGQPDESEGKDNDPFMLVMLDPARLSFSRSAGGLLQAVIEGTAYNEIALYRAFPLTRPEEYISVRTPEGEEIGLIAELRQLDAESLAEAHRELGFSYLMPRAIRIYSIRQKPAMWTWNLETDRGDMVLKLRNLHDHVTRLGAGRFIIEDAEGRKCEIDEGCLADERSRKQLRKIR